MWKPEFLLVLSALAFVLSLAAALFAARAASRVTELQDRLGRLSNSSSASLLKRVESAESKIEEVAVILGELAQKVKMMKVRNATHHVREGAAPGSEPDPYREPDRWRDWANDRLARAKLTS